MTRTADSAGAIEYMSALLLAANDRRWGTQGVYQFAPSAAARVHQAVATNDDASQNASLSTTSLAADMLAAHALAADALAVASLEELVRRRAR